MQQQADEPGAPQQQQGGQPPAAGDQGGAPDAAPVDAEALAAVR